MAYGQSEPGIHGFLVLSGQPKPTGAGTGTSVGDTLSYDRATDQWKKAVAGSLKPFGFNHNLIILTQVLDMMTGQTTYTRGAADADATLSVQVKGRIEKTAGGAIPPGELVMPDATAPATKVMAWDGTSRSAVIGRYIRNLTNWHNVDVTPAAALNDAVMIDIEDADI